MQKALPHFLKNRAEQSSNETAFRVLNAQGQWDMITWGTFYQEMVDLAYYLKNFGVKQGDVVAMLSRSNYQWELYHHALLHLGAVVVGIDPNEPHTQMESMLKTANIKTIVTDQQARLEKLKPLWEENHLSILSMEDVQIQNKNCKNELEEIPEESIATIIFTSGTTGVPKGIPYTHKQLLLAVDLLLDAYSEIPKGSSTACWLPLSNLFQRIVNICAIGRCAQTYFVEQAEKIVEILPKINPHFFAAVPRFYEKLYQTLNNHMRGMPFFQRIILNFCLIQGEGNSTKSRFFQKINARLFKKFKNLFGSNMRYMLSGSAPMPLWLLKRYQSLGLLILEVYGLSENVVPIALNRIEEYQLGSVGKALLGNELRIAPDGELLVKGEGVFRGYLNQANQDSKSVDNGFLHTGDMAQIDKNGFVKLIGRKTEMFKTSTGRKIVPSVIEEVIRQIPGVKQTVVYGENKQFLVALVDVHQPKEQDINTFIQNFSFQYADQVKKVPNYQQPAGVILLRDGFSIEKNEITCNLKLRRKNIYENYKDEISQLYKELEGNNSMIYQKPITYKNKIMLAKV